MRKGQHLTSSDIYHTVELLTLSLQSLGKHVESVLMHKLAEWQSLTECASDTCAGIVPAGFSEYLRTFTEMPAGARAVDTSGRTALPYLPRTLPHMTPATMEEQSAILLATAMLHNGLECKVATTTSKVLFSEAG